MYNIISIFLHIYIAYIYRNFWICHLLLSLTLFSGHLLAEVAPSVGVRSSVYCNLHF